MVRVCYTYIYCEKLNIKNTIFNLISDVSCNFPTKVLLTNGALLEIEKERGKRNLSLKDFSCAISKMSDNEDTSHITPDFLRHCTQALQDKKK